MRHSAGWRDRVTLQAHRSLDKDSDERTDEGTSSSTCARHPSSRRATGVPAPRTTLVALVQSLAVAGGEGEDSSGGEYAITPGRSLRPAASIAQYA